MTDTNPKTTPYCGDCLFEAVTCCYPICVEEKRAEWLREQRVAWCEAHSIDPYANVADGGYEAWQLVTDAEIANADS